MNDEHCSYPIGDCQLGKEIVTLSRGKLDSVVADINRAIPLIRKWTNINSFMGPDLQEAGNILSGILAGLPESQARYLEQYVARVEHGGKK